MAMTLSFLATGMRSLSSWIPGQKSNVIFFWKTLFKTQT